MQPLKQIQQQFKDYILKGRSEMEALVAVPRRDSVTLRLEIYADAYLLRLLETLAVCYPQLKKLMGESEFEKLSRAYAETYPSENPAIDYFGARLATFMAETSPYHRQPFLAEWAQFEWSLLEVTQTPAVPVLDTRALQEIGSDDWPVLCLKFHPNLRVLQCEWNLIAVFQAVANDRPIPTWEVFSSSLMLWPRDFQSCYKMLHPHEAIMLRQLRAGESFAAAYEALLPTMPEEEIATFMVQNLQEWLEQGLIVECEANLNAS